MALSLVDPSPVALHLIRSFCVDPGRRNWGRRHDLLVLETEVGEKRISVGSPSNLCLALLLCSGGCYSCIERNLLVHVLNYNELKMICGSMERNGGTAPPLMVKHNVFEEKVIDSHGITMLRCKCF
uniref:Uncharacterized protein n=1 Tax=Oryza punctata TaxID=4537 RepID=A0A0E0MEI1_ORYPU